MVIWVVVEGGLRSFPDVPHQLRGKDLVYHVESSPVYDLFEETADDDPTFFWHHYLLSSCPRGVVLFELSSERRFTATE